MSRRMSPSMKSSMMMPPSRIGIGNRLKIARFKLIAAIRLSSGIHPCWRAASPEAFMMPIGPSICFTETFRSIIFCTSSKISRENFLFCSSERRKACWNGSLSTCCWVAGVNPSRYAFSPSPASVRRYGVIEKCISWPLRFAVTCMGAPLPSASA